MNNRKELLIIASTTCVLLLLCGIVLYNQINHSTETSPNTPSSGTKKNDSLNKMGKVGSSSLKKRKKRKIANKKQKDEHNTSYSLTTSEWNTVVSQLRKSRDPQEKIDLINSLATLDSIALTKLILELLKDKDEDVRLAAIELLNGKEQGDILKCVEYALDDPNKDVREMAVILISDANEPKRYAALLLKGVGDSSEDVRAAIFDVLEDKAPSIQAKVFEISISSSYEDVKENTVEMLMNTPTTDTIEILFNGLDDDDAEFRDFVNTKMDLLFSHEFKNSSEAMKWWRQNKKKFDKDLFEK